MSIQLHPEQRALLDMFGPDTYCIDIPHSEHREDLVKRGYLEWVPAPAWSGRNTYAITQEGKDALLWLA